MDEWLHFGALSSIPLCLCLYYMVYYCSFVMSFEKNICEMCITDFWTQRERERVGGFGRMAL